MEDSLGMLFRRSTRSSDSGVGSRVLSPLVVNSTPSSSLKEVVISEEAADEESGVINDEKRMTETPPEKRAGSVQSFSKYCRQSIDVGNQETHSALPHNTERSRTDMMLGTVSDSGNRKEYHQLFDDGIQETHSPLPDNSGSSDTDLMAVNESFDAKIAQHEGPKASPSKLDGSSSSPSCSEIEASSSHRLCFETPLLGPSTGIRARIHDYHYDVSTPANGNPAAFMFSPDDDQSLLSIQCPATYSSSSDVDTPQSRNVSTHPVHSLFSNQSSLRVSMARNHTGKTTELME